MNPMILIVAILAVFGSLIAITWIRHGDKNYEKPPVVQMAVKPKHRR